MKKTLTIFMMIISTGLSAGPLPKASQFSIIKRAGNRYFLLKKRDEMKAHLKKDTEKKLEILKINVAGNNPEVVGVKSIAVAPDFYCVVYKAGESGTKAIIIEQRCALYNKKELRFEGDIPYKFIPKGKTAKSYPQPLYKKTAGHLEIYDNQVLIRKFALP